MNKPLLSFLFLLGAAASAFAQAPCGTMEYRTQQMRADSTLQQKIDAYETALQTNIHAQRSATKRSVLTIPVVVHVLYKTDTQNISDQRIIDQIAVTNRDFAGRNPHSMGAFPASMKANTGIQFCLAQFKPDGSPFNGINRVPTNVDYFIQNDNMKFTASGGVDAWDPGRYLNIWVCNYVVVDQLGYVFSAYAQFPSSGINETYGVAIRYGAFGPTDSNYYRGNGGILTHELGHCMNVYHIWGDDGTGCGGSDLCDDSPNQAGRTTGIKSGLLTDNCTAASPGIMYMNFMDYCDDIIYANFTPDQAARMQANFSPGSDLLRLAQSSACTFSTALNATPVAPALQLFPNPASGSVTLRCAALNSPDTRVLLYDVFGRLILSETAAAHASEHTIALQGLSKGVYTVVVFVNGLVVRERLVVE